MPLKRILVVDDEPEIVDSLVKKLSAEGFHVIQASRAKEAIDKTQTFSFDLILMDILLPDIDGAEAVRILHENPKTKHIPVIFLSGIAPKKEKGQSPAKIIAGGIAFPALPKPFAFEELLAEIHKIIP